MHYLPPIAIDLCNLAKHLVRCGIVYIFCCCAVHRSIAAVIFARLFLGFLQLLCFTSSSSNNLLRLHVHAHQLAITAQRQEHENIPKS